MPRRRKIVPNDRDPIGFPSRDKFIEYVVGHDIDKEEYRKYRHLYHNARSRGKVVTIFVPQTIKGKVKYKRIVVPTEEILSYLIQRGFIDESILKKGMRLNPIGMRGDAE